MLSYAPGGGKKEEEKEEKSRLEKSGRVDFWLEDLNGAAHPGSWSF